MIDSKGREIGVDVIDENGTIIDSFDWPFCDVEGCENRICLNISEKYCHPHSGGKMAEEITKELNKELV